jgi:hypothetical protein
VAVVGDLRLPTGRKKDLLGAGTPSFRALASGSIESGHVAVDLNGGFTAGGVTDEINHGAFVSARLRTSRWSANSWADGLRTSAPSPSRAPHPTIAGVDTIRLITTGTSLHTAVAVAGFKWNVFGGWLINGNVSAPVTNGGLRSRITPRIGVEYTLLE